MVKLVEVIFAKYFTGEAKKKQKSKKFNFPTNIYR